MVKTRVSDGVSGRFRLVAGCRHQRGARRRAHRLRIELRQLCPATGQLVYVGSLEVRAAVEADVFPAEVIGDDVDNVGFLCRRRRQREAGGQQGRQKCFRGSPGFILFGLFLMARDKPQLTSGEGSPHIPNRLNRTI